MRYQYGFSLLEVLIATFILALGLFGIIGIHINSLKCVESSYQRALVVSQKIAEFESDGFR